MILMDFMRVLIPPTTQTVMWMPQTLVPLDSGDLKDHHTPPWREPACLAGCPSHRGFFFYIL